MGRAVDRWSDESIERVLVGRRSNRRTRLHVEVEVRACANTWMPARLLEISVAGFRLEALPRNASRRSLWLRIGNSAPLPAKVIWSTAAEIGCEFLRPVKRAALDDIIRAFQPWPPSE